MEIIREKNRVKAHEIDCKGRMSLPALINNMQEAAWNNAELLGASVARLQEDGISWVLTRLKMEIDRFPHHKDYYYIESWPSGENRSFVYRDYRVYDEEGICIARATSTWLVFDLDSRKMVAIPDWLKSLTSLQMGKEVLTVATGKIPIVPPDPEGLRFPVRWHDIDTNQHLSNVCYFQCAIEGMPLEVLSEKTIKSIDMNFRSESSWGDNLQVSVEQKKAGTYLHTLRRESDDKILALAKSSWRD